MTCRWIRPRGKSIEGCIYLRRKVWRKKGWQKACKNQIKGKRLGGSPELIIRDKRLTFPRSHSNVPVFIYTDDPVLSGKYLHANKEAKAPSKFASINLLNWIAECFEQIHQTHTMSLKQRKSCGHVRIEWTFKCSQGLFPKCKPMQFLSSGVNIYLGFVLVANSQWILFLFSFPRAVTVWHSVDDRTNNALPASSLSPEIESNRGKMGISWVFFFVI